MNTRSIRTIVVAVVLGVAVIGCGTKGGDQQQSAQQQQPQLQINGAGATFPSPIYSKWFDEYHKIHPDVRINYQPVGSGAGIRQLVNQTVFFGATDGPMTDEQLKSAPGPPKHDQPGAASCASRF